MTAVQDTDVAFRRPRAAGGAERIDGLSTPLRLLCLAAIAIGVAAGLYFYLHRGSLWEDEIIALTHANQPLPLFFIELLRNDIHPPLYFLQLDGWMALGGSGDRWALANSLAWAVVSLVAMFTIARSLHGARAAWIATALFAVLPNFVWSAGTLRMYAGLPACVLFVYYANRQWFESRDGRWLAACLVVEVLVAYLHAVEFFFVAFIVFGALAEAASTGRLRMPSMRFRHSVRMWLIFQVLFGVCVLPLAASALVRGSDAAAPDTALAMLAAGGMLVAGWKTSSILWVRMAGLVIFLLLTGAALSDRGSRWRTLGIPIAALVVALAIAVLFKPIFKQPVFAANLLPFVVLGAAAAASRTMSARVPVVACIVALAIAAFPLALRQAQPEGYAAAARAVRDRVVAGDVVVVPNVSVFWGIARYAVGPDWGRPLAIMPAPNAEWARLNDRIARSLGADAPARLGLVPDRDYVERDGVRYILGSDVAAATKDAPHVWLVTRERYQVDVKLDPALKASEVVAPETFGDGELSVRRYDRPGAP